MLYFPLLWDITFTYSYTTIKDECPTSYVSSSSYFTMEDTAVIQRYNQCHIMLDFYLLYSKIP